MGFFGYNSTMKLLFKKVSINPYHTVLAITSVIVRNKYVILFKIIDRQV